jgi:hypothetical protein
MTAKEGGGLAFRRHELLIAPHPWTSGYFNLEGIALGLK